MHTHATAEAAVTLSYLLVESEAFTGHNDATASLYANGKQHSTVLVTLQARDSNGEAVGLPSNAKVELIPYVGAYSGTWKVTNASSDFEVFPERTAVVQAIAPDPQNQQFKLYIYNNNATTSTLSDRFAVQVTWGGLAFRTNHPDVEYGGSGDAGKFNSSFKLQSVPAQKYRVSEAPAQEIFRGTVNGFTGSLKRVALTLTHPTTGQPARLYASAPVTNFASTHHNKVASGVYFNSIKAAIPNLPASLSSATHELFKKYTPTPEDYSILISAWSRVDDTFTAREQSVFSGPLDVYGNPVSLNVHLVSERTTEPAYWELYKLTLSTSTL
ncbi:hypothetical protein [Pseudomonas shirazensis]|uniref:hypothetical protein n=1 Tax=Pseudomonas shirazensis TaxID=2745494 RepID=UPI003D2DA4D9